MELIPISNVTQQNKQFTQNPECAEILHSTLEFYKKVGFKKPWISYYAQLNNELVGCCAFKGAPVNRTVEIAYGTFENHRQKGIGAEMCKQLVEISLNTDPTVKVTARTLPEKNFSTRILEKNNFEFTGIVIDPEDGEVWEWAYKKIKE